MFKSWILILGFLLIINPEIYAQQDSEINTNKLQRKSYFELGLLGGMPAYINLTTGYYYKHIGFRISGGYINENSNGFQCNLNYKISDNYKIRHNIGVAIGNSQDTGCNYCYVGPVYDLTYKKIFIELGISKVFDVRSGDFSELPYWVLFQMGYVHRFLPKIN